MSDERYVVLAVGPPRAEWMRRLTQWCQSAALPVELVKCISVKDVASRLEARQPVSAAIVDERAGGLDRDALDAARRSGCPTLVLGRGRGPDWKSLGANCVIEGELTRSGLLAALREHASPLRSATALDQPPAEHRAPPGRIVAVTGPGGTGASCTAMALAQGLAGSPSALVPADPDGTGHRRPPWRVLLADLKRHAEQAVLHDSGDLAPGVQELVDSCRRRHPSPAETVGMTFDVAERGYHLLLGLRRPSAWVDLPPQAFAVGLDALQSTYEVAVCDIDCDLEGVEDGGSGDVEERNVMARTVVARADAVVVVGRGGVKGLYSLSRVLDSLGRFGVPPARLLPVLVDPRQSSGARRDVRRALEAVTAAGVARSAVWVFDRDLDEALRDGVALPSTLSRPLADAVVNVVGRAGAAAPPADAASASSPARRGPALARQRNPWWHRAGATA